MKVVALISGGKDSCYSILKCIQFGHSIVALANLKPPSNVDELDSFMYQSVGHEVIDSYSECIGVPLFRGEINGKAVQQELTYDSSNPNQQDEVEDLFLLLSRVLKEIPDIKGVCSGAILSNYQRNRVENVCERLGLVSFAYLWQRDQGDLLNEMIASNMNAILIKVAAIGLEPKKHLGKSLGELSSQLFQLNKLYDVNVCGEGGEYESLTLDAPYFKKRIVIDESEIIYLGSQYDAVAYLKILKFHLESKDPSSILPLQVDLSSNTLASVSFPELSQFPAPKIQRGDNDEWSSNSFSTGVHFSLDQEGLKHQFTSTMSKIISTFQQKEIDFKRVFFVFVYLKDMNLFVEMNTEYGRFFGSNPPSRACVSIPMDPGCEVMIECLYHQSALTSTLHVQSISSWAPACIGPYSQAKTVGQDIFLAGQIGLVPSTMQLVSNDTLQQLDQILSNTSEVLMVLRSSLKKVLIWNVYLTNMKEKERVKQVIDQVSSNNSIIKFIGVVSLPKSSSIEIQVIASQDDPNFNPVVVKGTYSVHTSSTNDLDIIQYSVNSEKDLDGISSEILDWVQGKGSIGLRCYYDGNSSSEERLIGLITPRLTSQVTFSFIPCNGVGDNLVAIFELSSLDLID